VNLNERITISRSKSFLLLALVIAGHLSIAFAQSSGTFSATGKMTTPRGVYSATLLPNGKVLIVGGNYTGSCCLASAELYDPLAGTFTATGNMITPRAAHSATLLPNGKVLIAGGYTSGGKPLASAELYDPSTGRFTPTADMVTGAGAATAILLANGKVLITHPRYGAGPAAAEIYDPLTGTFSATGDRGPIGKLGWATTGRFACRREGLLLLLHAGRTV
jgi:galactose oxidase-like protein